MLFQQILIETVDIYIKQNNNSNKATRNELFLMNRELVRIDILNLELKD